MPTFEKTMTIMPQYGDIPRFEFRRKLSNGSNEIEGMAVMAVITEVDEEKDMLVEKK
jgi:hypothetical protein